MYFEDAYCDHERRGLMNETVGDKDMRDASVTCAKYEYQKQVV